MSEVEELLAGDPERAVAWTSSLEASVTDIDADRLLDLLGFAGGAAVNAARAADPEPAKLWAEAAIRVFELLSAACPSCEPSAMMLRVQMISRFGPSGVDPGVVVRWFHDRCRLTPAEIAVRSERWNAGFAESRTRLLELRKIKNHLSVVAELEKAYPESIDDRTRAYLNLRDRLP